MPQYAVTLYRVRTEVREDGSVIYLNTDDEEGAQPCLEGKADIQLVLDHIRTYSPESGEPEYEGRLPHGDIFSVPKPLEGAKMLSAEPEHSILAYFKDDPDPGEWLCRNGGKFLGRANYTDEGCIGNPEGEEYIYEYTIQFEKLDSIFPPNLIPEKNHIHLDINLVTGKAFYRLCRESSEYPSSLGIFQDVGTFYSVEKIKALKEMIFGHPDSLEMFPAEEEDANFFPPGCSRDAARERAAAHPPASGGAAGSSHPG